MNPIPPPVTDDVLPWLRGIGERLVVIFKDSPTCGTSRVARRTFDAYVQTAGTIPADYLVVNVLAERPLSTAIAKASGVRHESPQVLLVKNGMVVWHTSHIGITEDALKRQIGRFSAPPAENLENLTAPRG